MTDKLIEALERVAHESILETRSGAKSVGAITTARYEGMAAVRSILAELDRLGWQCTPKEPTPEMIMAGLEHGGWACGAAWNDMVAAAPKLGGE